MRLGRVPGVRQIPALLQRVDEAVLFESWHGEYSDNPRAISERLHERMPGLEQIWATADAGCPPHSRRYLNALGRAKYVVSDLNMPAYFRKKKGTTYVQTWHGTPLKRIGYDVDAPTFLSGKAYLDALSRDVARWDVLVSPNRFSTEIFRRAFRYDGRIVETGYPRNDILSSPQADETGASVRSRLGIPHDSRVLLYAPTWRDDDSPSLRLDTGGLTKALGDELHVLVRAHKRVAETIEADPNARVIDVSSYPDIRDLYLAADVLVTDYSSAMFDFAVTGKPMLFYTYDLDHYRDVIRGFYFDFEREAPGPLLATTEEVCEALRDLDALRRHYADAYASFKERFCYLEDGRAAERVIEATFSS